MRVSVPSPMSVFPNISRSYIERCQFSSWYPVFERISPRATVIRPLPAEFREYLEEDGVIVPEGSEDFPVASSLPDNEVSDDEQGPPPKRHAFPELDTQIRKTIANFEAVFPKLNWTSPRDASWILPTLKCTSPADVYLLLKSSDFVSHDVDPKLAFEGCLTDAHAHAPHELELVLKKWYSMDRGREFRCFVRDEILLGITQRELNYYPHLNEQDTKGRIIYSISEFWKRNIRTEFRGGSDYVFDVHLTRDLSSAHLLDFNPYHPKTDPLLFTYDDLFQLLISVSSHVGQDGPCDTKSSVPELRVITSPSDPAASRNAPANQHNAVPFDALQMSSGNDINTFATHWGAELKRTLEDDDTDSETAG